MLQRSGQGLHRGGRQLKALDKGTVGHQMPLATRGIKLTKQRLPVQTADRY
jgi:hypothetical protein